MTLNLRHLHYFLTMVEEGSVTGAAARLRITQPTLSRQLSSFEHDLGWELFDRRARTLKLTRAGRVVAEEGEKLRNEVENTQKKMRQRIDGRAIRVAYSPSLAGEILKKALVCFQQRHPQVRVELFDYHSEDMRRGIRSGTLDLMIEEKSGETDLEWLILQQKSWRVALRSDDPLARRKKIQARDLDGRRLLLFSRHDYPAYGKSVTAYFRREKINAKVAGEFDGIESLTLGLESGMGVALLVEGTRFSDKISLLPLVPAPEKLSIAVAWRADESLDARCESFVNELVLAAQ